MVRQKYVYDSLAIHVLAKIRSDATKREKQKSNLLMFEKPLARKCINSEN